MDNSTDHYTPLAPPGGIDQRLIQQYFMIGIAVVGILGNLTSGYVLLLSNTIRKSTSSRILVSQSFVDLITCVAALADMLVEAYVQNSSLSGATGVLLCWTLIGQFAFHTSITISTYNMLSLTLERAASVVIPIFHHAHFSRSLVTGMIATSWAIGVLLISASLFPSSKVVDGVCVNWAYFPSDVYRRVFGVADILFTYIVPLSVIATCYVTIYATLYAPGCSGGQAQTVASTTPTPHKEQRRRERRRKNGMLRTMLTIVACYVICNSLRHVVIVSHKFGVDISLGGLLERVGVVFMFSNSAANPIIYTFQYRDYQRELRRLLTRVLGTGLFGSRDGAELSRSQAKYETESGSYASDKNKQLTSTIV